MPKIKLIKFYGVNSSYDDYYEMSAFVSGISEWEEVTEEEVDFIRANLHHIKTGGKFKVIMVEQCDSDDFPNYISDIKGAINKAKKREEAMVAEIKRKKEERAAARMAKKLTRDRNLLAKLVKDNPELLKDIVEKTT